MDDLDEFIYRTETVADAIGSTARKYENLVRIDEAISAPAAPVNPLSRFTSQVSPGEFVAILIAIVGLAWK